MPALRTRIEDLPLLVRDFSRAQRRPKAAASVELTARTLQALSRYPWPGNVRELGNLIERLSILCPNRRVDVADLPPKYRPAASCWSQISNAGAMPSDDAVAGLAIV